MLGECRILSPPPGLESVGMGTPSCASLARGYYLAALWEASWSHSLRRWLLTHGGDRKGLL